MVVLRQGNEFARWFNMKRYKQKIKAEVPNSVSQLSVHDWIFGSDNFD
jgi:hypothetical protein